MQETKKMGTKAYEIAKKFKISIEIDSTFDSW